MNAIKVSSWILILYKTIEGGLIGGSIKSNQTKYLQNYDLEER